MPVAILVWLLGCVHPLHGQETDRPFPSRALGVPRDQIAESFLAYLVGLIDSDTRFLMDSRSLAEALPELSALRGDPFQFIREVGRHESGPRLMLTFGFVDDLLFPLPLGILGYHPISVSVSRDILLEEQRFTARRLGDDGALVLAPYYEYRVVEGHASFFFADWLVYLSGGFLDNFSVEGAALFKYGGEWRALIAGRGRKNQVICWFYDLRHTRFIMAVPKQLVDLAGHLAP
jgi:hypothetical protein